MLGTGSHGQGIETTIAQVVADELGVEFDDVTVHQGDTLSTPFGAGTGGSRTAVVVGGAARASSRAVREQVLAVAAHLLEAAVEDLELDRGVVSVVGTPSRSVTLVDVAALSYLRPEQLPADIEPGLEATVRFRPPPVTWSNAAHLCTVEIDAVTGHVDIDRYVVSEDCGVMINPMVVEGQVRGGVMQGIAGVLYEELAYDGDGNPLATSFMDYLLPTASEGVDIEMGHVETPSDSPGGHKGMGEGGAIGSVPCVANAISDALAPLGVTITDLPMSPSKIADLIASVREGDEPTDPVRNYLRPQS
jgi:carbon-monoxide dehydrogenase large subunit